eukprot:2767695-Pleurochrysis_carterae.AAC.6
MFVLREAKAWTRYGDTAKSLIFRMNATTCDEDHQDASRLFGAIRIIASESGPSVSRTQARG